MSLLAALALTPFAKTLTLLPSNILTLLAETWRENPLLLSLSWCTIVLLLSLLSHRPRRVFLLDYACYTATSDRRCSYEVCEYLIRRSGRISPASQLFMREIYAKSGIGDETYAPPFFFSSDFDSRFHSAMQEAEEGIFSAVESLLGKTRIDPGQIDVLIAACTTFYPCPSLTSMLVHRFGFHPAVKSFNLSGMGCSGGGIAIDLVTKILRRKPGYALIVATENTSLNWYLGEERSMIPPNCMFRMGSVAILLTSDPAKLGDSKMELLRCLRTHHASDNAAYNVALQQEDEQGNLGIALTRDLVGVVGAGLRSHITRLAPLVLPFSEVLLFLVKKKTPDFMKGFEHICLHPGGRAVVNGVGRMMGLPESAVEPARMTLHRFGNTSSSSVFYELGYFEAKDRLRKGDRMWMLLFGNGFKACSLVWRCLRDSGFDPVNPWNDCAFRYPVY